MELWNMGNKLIVLLFVVSGAYFMNDRPSRWLVFYFLVYIAINLSAQIIRNRYAALAVIWIGLAYILACSVYIDPYFMLLYPFSIFELASYDGHRQNGYYLLLLVPLWLISGPLLMLYILVAVLSMMNFLLISKSRDKAQKQEEQLDKIRHSQDQLRRKLHENEEFMRVSEYTYKLEERNRLSQEIHDG
ncbi:hypothetical protein RE628_08440 [Paenibacillus sp. D2_2]|uniref:hypothetical protein n=1 Tax=Paenibacillus sp. D2_2 TaxID=3073092 RepID=UPI00281623CB|nr:hypothetical protein [Paenibacillus sp. D2_2]WMT42389.1 hypothetical protein RE628_08440 [Paenibacillus sp. D2_2]